MAGCLGDDEIAAYVDGALALEAVAETDRHAAGCETCRARLSTVAGSPVLRSFTGDATGDGTGATAVDIGDPSVPGTRLGRYVVESAIGRGGMGVVVRAHDPELDRAIAIKQIRPGVGGAWRTRLRAEARAMARLRHPNVVAVYDVGSVGDQAFITMELVDGTSLARWLAAPHSRAVVLDACIAAGRGLCAAHAAGVVHGDIKPDNILIDRDGRALIGDFGLSRAIADTHAGGLAGTPAYMAPELFDGAPPDERSDQFAFAVTVCEALSGERPLTLDGAARAVQLAGSDLPRHRPAALPAALWRTIAPALATDPAARYPTLEAFVDRLARRAGRRRPWLIAGAAGAVAAAAAAAVVVVALGGAAAPACADPAARASAIAAGCGGSPSPSCAALAAMLDRRAAAWRTTHLAVCRATRTGAQPGELLDRRMRCLDERLLEHTAVAAKLGAPPVAEAAARDGLTALARLEPPERCATADGYRAPPAGKAPAVEVGRQWVASAQADYALGRFREGAAGLAPRLAAIRALGDPPLLALAAQVLGKLQLGASAFGEAEVTLNEALRAAAEAGEDARTAQVLLDLSYLVGEKLGDRARGAELLRAAEAAVVRAGAPPQLDAWLRSQRAAFAADRGDYPAAEADLVQAAELRRRDEGPDGPNTGFALMRLCEAESSTGKLEAARRHCEDGLAIQRKALGPDHPRVAEAENGLAIALAILGDLTAARRHWELALATYERMLGPNANQLLPVLMNLSSICQQLRDAPAGERYLARAAALANARPDSADALEIRVRTAMQLDASHRQAEAIPMLEDAIRRADAQLGADHPTSVAARSELAEAYTAVRRFRDARTMYERALAGTRKLYGAQHAATLDLEGQYGLALIAVGELRPALAVIERATTALEATVAKDSVVLAGAYTHMADVLYRLGSYPRAADYAAKGLAIREQHEDDPVRLAYIRYVVGRNNWRANRDRRAAAALVKRARDEMHALGAEAIGLADMDRWLAGDR